MLDQFREVNWVEGVYKGFNGPVIGNGLAATVDGGFGNMLFQNLERPAYSIWLNDYRIEKGFKARTFANYRSLEFRINLSQGVEHKTWSGKWKPVKPFDLNLTHSLVMDSEVRIANPGHYHSLDIHFKPEMFERLMVTMPELVSPFLNEFHAGRQYELFTNDVPPNKEIMQLVKQLLLYMQSEECYDLLDSAAEVLLGCIFLWKASETQRKGLSKSQLEAHKRLQTIRGLIAAESFFKGVGYYAKQAFMGTTKFKEAFYDLVGESPGRYFVGIKLQKGLVALLNTDASVIDIALDLNYNDSAAFIKAFIGRVGVPPQQYRMFLAGI